MFTQEFNIVPKLRFLPFNKNWNTDSLKSYVIEHKGGAPLQPKDFVDFKGYEVIPKKAIMPFGRLMLDKNKPTFCSKSFFNDYQNSVINGDYLVTTLRDLVPSGPSIGYIVEFSQHEKYMLAQGVYGFKIKENQLNRSFLIQLSNTDKYRRLMRRLKVGSTQVHIRNNDFFGIKIHFPEYDEQQKIANFLSSVDKKIQQLTEKQSLLQQFKKGIMQKLFSQEIRFKDDQGNYFSDWEEKALGTLADKINNKNKDEAVKNVLTNSAKQGIINQTDYFDKDIANQNNLGGYYIVEKDDFVYNPRISEAAPVGPIKRNKLFTGVMSPLYTVFRFQNDSYLTFLELYFDTTFWHRYMKGIANYGARHDRMNITMGDFMKLPLPYPSKPEMRKIVDFIEAIDSKLAMVTAQVEQTKTFKKGLLQQMFV